MKKNKILIIDDDDKLRFNISLFFEDEGFECHVCETAEDALIKLDKNRFDVAIVDLRLPGMNGEEFMTAAYKIDPHLKCVLYTGSADYRITDELKSIGLQESDIFLKPMEDMSILLNYILSKIK